MAQKLDIGNDVRKNVFVTQINEREEEDIDNVQQIPVVKEPGSHLLETGLNTLQKTLVLKREAELSKIDKDLLEKRREFQRRMDKCGEKRLELQRRQQSIKDQVAKFDQFIKENEAKRRRAMHKFQEEARLKEIKTREVVELKEELKLVKAKHKAMTDRVKQYKKFETYLLHVIDLLPPDYIKVADNMLGGLMMRHNTLATTNQELLTLMTDKGDEVKKLRTEHHELREDHNKRVLSMNSKLSELHDKREKEIERYHRMEQEFRYKHGDVRNQIENFGMILRSIENLADKCLKRYDPTVLEISLNGKLEKIEEYLLDMQDIIHLVDEELYGGHKRRTVKASHD